MSYSTSDEESMSEFGSVIKSNRIEIADSLLHEQAICNSEEETARNANICSEISVRKYRNDYYVDNENIPSLYKSSIEKKTNKRYRKRSIATVTAENILNCEQEGCSGSGWYNFFDKGKFDINMFKTELVDFLKSEDRFFEIRAGSGKNSADITMVITAARDHYTKPMNLIFILVSGDRGFGVIVKEFCRRRVVVINPHHRMSFSDLKKLINDTGQNNEGKTKLGKCVEELSKQKGLSKVIFILSLSAQLPEQEIDLGPGTIHLLFAMERNDSEGGDFVFLTQPSYKEDAPLFLLAVAIVEMHHNIVDTSVVFEIRSCVDTIPFDVLRNGCPGRKVEIPGKTPQSPESELVPSQHNEESNFPTQEGSTDVVSISEIKNVRDKNSLEINIPNIGANRSDLVQPELYNPPNPPVLINPLPVVGGDQHPPKPSEMNTSKHLYKCEKKETLAKSNPSRQPAFSASTNGARPKQYF